MIFNNYSLDIGQNLDTFFQFPDFWLNPLIKIAEPVMILTGNLDQYLNLKKEIRPRQ